MTTASELTFTGFMDFLLVRLYELERSAGDGEHFDFFKVADELKQPVPRQWVEDAMRTLAGRGWVHDWGLDNATMGRISGEGRLYVDAKQHETDVIEQYRREPSNFVFVSGGISHQIAVGTRGDVHQASALSVSNRDDLLALVEQIRETLIADDSLDRRTRDDALADVDAIEGQLKKSAVNKQAIAALLGGLGGIASVAQLVVKVGELLA